MPTPPPRVLIVSPDRTTRALLGAELRERGYDAVGAASPGAALRIPREETGHGPVRLVIATGPIAEAETRNVLANTRERFEGCRMVLVASGVGRAAGDVGAGWDRVLHRPISIGQIVAAAEALLPLAPEHRHPLDG